jgi:hypothetical protein
MGALTGFTSYLYLSSQAESKGKQKSLPEKQAGIPFQSLNKKSFPSILHFKLKT